MFSEIIWNYVDEKRCPMEKNSVLHRRALLSCYMLLIMCITLSHSIVTCREKRTGNVTISFFMEIAASKANTTNQEGTTQKIVSMQLVKKPVNSELKYWKMVFCTERTPKPCSVWKNCVALTFVCPWGNRGDSSCEHCPW